MWSCSKRLAYMVANFPAKESEKIKAKRERVTREQPAASITPTLCSLPGLHREETITVTHAVDVF